MNPDHQMLQAVCISCSVVWNSATQWTIACQAPLSMGILQTRILEWIAMPSTRGSSQPMDQTQVSHTAGRFLSPKPPGKPQFRFIKIV